MPEHRKSLYCKDFYTASNFYPKIFQPLKKIQYCKKSVQENLIQFRLPAVIGPGWIRKLTIEFGKQEAA